MKRIDLRGLLAAKLFWRFLNRAINLLPLEKYLGSGATGEGNLRSWRTLAISCSPLEQMPSPGTRFKKCSRFGSPVRSVKS